MNATPAGIEIERVIELLAKLPGFGPRSARRAALAMLRRPETLLAPLARAMEEAKNKVSICERCGNIGTEQICGICSDPKRNSSGICVVEDIADLWALERTQVYRGRYHVLGGALSALKGVNPEQLNIPKLVQRVKEENTKELILALPSTIDGRTTAHYISDMLSESGAEITILASGVPIGGELDYLDDGTICAAFKERKAL